MAKRDRRKDQESKKQKSETRTVSLHQPLSQQEISLKESISKLENKLLEEEVKKSPQAVFSINKMIEAFQARLKKK